MAKKFVFANFTVQFAFGKAVYENVPLDPKRLGEAIPLMCEALASGHKDAKPTSVDLLIDGLTLVYTLNKQDNSNG